MVFRNRWINLLRRATTGTKETHTLLTPVGVTIFGAFTALFVIAAIVVDSPLSLPHLPPEGATRLPVSVPMMAVGPTVTARSVIVPPLLLSLP